MSLSHTLSHCFHLQNIKGVSLVKDVDWLYLSRKKFSKVFDTKIFIHLDLDSIICKFEIAYGYNISHSFQFFILFIFLPKGVFLIWLKRLQCWWVLLCFKVLLGRKTILFSAVIMLSTVIINKSYFLCAPRIKKTAVFSTRSLNCNLSFVSMLL